MCGIICFFGQSDGVTRVLEAQHLLEYRAPDSSGLAVITEVGQFAINRKVGPPAHLVTKMARQPLHTKSSVSGQAAKDLLGKQGINIDPGSLRDLSLENGYTIEMLYQTEGLSIGVGDRGSATINGFDHLEPFLSNRMYALLTSTEVLASPDFDRDPVRHAFRLVSTHVTSRAKQDRTIRHALDTAFLARVPAGSYGNWFQAWNEEVAHNIPGQAFAVAARYFQENFHGLSEHIGEHDWERVGGVSARAMAQVVLGHGRWAMVGAVTETNSHPFLDRKCARAICENGSHNAKLLLHLRNEQEAWWLQRGIQPGEPVHRSENTTEVVVYEWERVFLQLQAGEIEASERGFLESLIERGILDAEEQALRIALHRLTPGNTHACAFYSLNDPGVLYVSSHRKPIAIAIRTLSEDEQLSRRELMVASDINAALMLWPGAQVDVAEKRIRELKEAVEDGILDEEQARPQIDQLLAQFTLDVIFLDADLHRGEELIARIENEIECGEVQTRVRVTRYDGSEVAVKPQQVRLDPALVGKRGFPTYTESHVDEIPKVFEALLKSYLQDGQVRLDALWDGGQLLAPGLNVVHLRDKFGPKMASLERILLIGEGSSWRDALAASPLIRNLQPDIVVNLYRPVEVLNLGEAINPDHDLAIEISWSGTTDSLLQVDDWLREMGVMRLAITGKPQSDLGRRTAQSGGTINVHSGVEISVATVKGYHAILTTLSLFAIQLAQLAAGYSGMGALSRLVDELRFILPRHLQEVINNEERRDRLRKVARRCKDFNKVAVIGDSPVDVEAELKIEELAQVVANAFAFNASSMRGLIERSAFVNADNQRTLFVINATTPEAVRSARPIVSYLQGLGVFCIVHATPHEFLAEWKHSPGMEVFVSPQVSDYLQPLIDAPFFFDLAVALAYARGLSPEEIDRPRHLAKSVTTTGAERRIEVESRKDFQNISLSDFCAGRMVQDAWDERKMEPSRAALRATVALRAALAFINEPPPERLALDRPEHLIVIADTEATENAARMAATAWLELLGVDLTVYRRFISDLPPVRAGTALLHMTRAGAVLSLPDAHTIALPADMTPLQWELLGSVYLISLGVRLARQRGMNTGLWECGLAQIPLILAQIFDDKQLMESIRAVLNPFVRKGYDKIQIIGGGQDFASAISMARSLCSSGFMAEALYTDSAWHGPLATVGGPGSDHDTLIFILATDPLFQPAALVDTQVYRTRNAPLVLVIPEGNQQSHVVRGVEANAVIAMPAVPRPFTPMVNVALGKILAENMAFLWGD